MGCACGQDGAHEIVTEEYDAKGNLVKRTTAKYTPKTTRPADPATGGTIPGGVGQIYTNPNKYILMNDLVRP